MTPIIKKFDIDVNKDSNLYNNKTACFELHDCIIDLREFGKHPEYDQSRNLKAYCGNRRIKKYINRNPVTNAVWYDEKVPTYEFEDETIDRSTYPVDTVIPELFFCYDYLEWQYSHFLTDVYPKMWYYPQLKKNFGELKFGQIRPILNFAYNLNDKTLNTKLNLISEFAHQITDFYINHFGYSDSFFPLEIGKVYRIEKLFLPVPFTSQDVMGWPSIQMEMYELLKKESDRVVTRTFSENIFISRRDTVKNGWFNLRHCVNEEDISNALISKGFEIVELMPLTIYEKIKVFTSAKKIVQMVGSNCFNTVFVNPNTMLYTIQHPHYLGWSPMLDSLAKAQKATYVPIVDGIEMLGLDGYPAEYRKNEDQPWKMTNIDNLIRKITE